MATSKPTTYICKNKYRGIFVCHQLIQLEILILETLVLSVGIGPIPLLSTSLSNDFRSVLNCLASHHWTIHNTIVFRNTHGLEPYLRLYKTMCLPLNTICIFFGFVFKPYLTQQIKLSYHTSVQSKEPFTISCVLYIGFASWSLWDSNPWPDACKAPALARLS